MPRVRRWSIRARVFSLLIAGSLIPIVLLGWLDLARTASGLLEGQAELLGARGDQIAGEIDQFNLRYLQAAHRISRIADLRAFLQSTESGASRNERRASLQDRLRTLISDDAGVAGIGIVDPAGAVVAATDPRSLPSDISRRSYFHAVRDQRAAVINMMVDAADQPLLAYAAPVWGEPDAPIGYLVVWVRADALWQLVQRSNGRAGTGSFAAVLDELGIRIAHTRRRERVFHPAGELPAATRASLIDEQRFGAATKDLLSDVYAFPEQFARARGEVSDTGMFRGFGLISQQYNYGVSRRLETAPWTVFYMVPEATLTAPIAAVRNQKLIFALVVLLLTVLLATWFTRQIIGPLGVLGAAANRLASGDMSGRVELDRGDELGALAGSFNAMAGEVADARRQLEAQVAERTADLLRANASLEDEIGRGAAAQVAVALSEQKYRELYEHSLDLMFTANLVTERFIDCNQTLCDRLGYTKAELFGQPFRMIYRPGFSLEDVADEAEQFEATGELGDVERVLQRRDGKIITVSVTARALRDERGQIYGMQCTCRDITARKQADRDLALLVRLAEALRSSTDEAELLHAVCAEIADHLHAPRCSFIEVDPHADRAVIRGDVHGDYPSLVGTHSLSAFGAGFIDDHSRGIPVAIADTAADPRTAASYETAYRAIHVRSWASIPLMRDGHWVASLTVAAPDIRRWEDRELHLLGLAAERVWVWIEHLRLLAELQDRRIKDAVAKTEARFRIMVDAIQDYAVFMLDPRGVIASWNAGAERIKGYTADEILGQSLAVFYTDDDVARGLPSKVLETARTLGRHEDEGWRVRKDGSRFWASVVVTAMRDASGKLDGFAKVTRDITERRHQEDELRGRQAQLTQHLKERDVLLQEIHHRVKNNLQVISSLINMQARKLEAGASREALQECQTRVLAIALIHEQLYQSKDYAAVQFADYVKSLAGNVFHTLGTSRSGIALELAVEPVPLSIDRAIPCGLLINELITNALKHAFKDGRTGTVRVALAREGSALRLEVRDDGIGLADAWDVRKPASLGLQLVRTLTEQLAGQLMVDGRHGASFQITFPAGAPEVAGAA